MASTSIDPEEVIYEAAASTKIPPKANWYMVRSFLEGTGVDVGLHTQKKWMEMFSDARISLDEIKRDGERAGRRVLDKAPQGAPEKVAEWKASMDQSTRKSDAVSIDSGYNSECSQDQNDRPECVIALVQGVEDYPQGKGSITCSYCDEDHENYMSPVISKRLKLQPGEDGKVALTFLWRDGGQSDIRRFSIRPAKEMEADIRFGMKHEEENTKMDMEEADDDPILGMQHLDHSYGPLAKRREPSIDYNDIGAKAVGVAIGYACAESNNQDYSRVGHAIGATAKAAMASFR